MLIEGLHEGLRQSGADVTVVSNENIGDLWVWMREADSSSAAAHNFGLWTPLNHFVAKECRRRFIPVVCGPMGMLDPWALGEKTIKKKVAWVAYQARDAKSAVCLHATAELELFQFRAAGLTQPVAVIPCGVHLPDAVSPGPHAGDDRPLRVLFLSRLHPKKGVLTWIEASRSIAGGNWLATIAGPSDSGYRAQVEAAIAAAGLGSHFTLSDPVYGSCAKKELFSKFDLFILPTHSENFGIVIAEALAHGLPVITTTSAPWQSLVREKAGWWVPPTVDGIGEALSAALALEREELAAMGARGRALVARSFSWPAIIKQHSSLYAWMLGQGPKPDFVRD